MQPLIEGDYQDMRAGMAREHTNVRWNKPTLDAGFTTLNALLKTLVTSYNALLDSETVPFVFTDDEKQTIFSLWLQQVAARNR